jgi:FAD:protein FMN transferase
MASPIVLSATALDTNETELFSAAEALFRDVDAQCSRFIAGNPLATLNESSNSWQAVPELLKAAIGAAFDAYVATAGLFDPRILTDIQRIGYVTSVTSSEYNSAGAYSRSADSAERSQWSPELDGSLVRIGTVPIDLGGIAKGLAVALVAQLWSGKVSSALINAGGDLAVIGEGPDAAGWRVGVENPRDRDGDPLVVLEVADCAVATSSTAIHSWTLNDGHTVHHLIDPRTGTSADSGLASVTVIAATATLAETWSKALFVGGIESIADLANERDLASIWIDGDGVIGQSNAADSLIIWKAHDVRN